MLSLQEFSCAAGRPVRSLGDQTQIELRIKTSSFELCERPFRRNAACKSCSQDLIDWSMDRRPNHAYKKVEPINVQPIDDEETEFRGELDQNRYLNQPVVGEARQNLLEMGFGSDRIAQVCLSQECNALHDSLPCSGPLADTPSATTAQYRTIGD